MSDKIIKFPKQTNLDAVEVLEAALQSAKDGEVVAVAISFVMSDGAICGDISSGKDQLSMLASLVHTKRSFEKQIFDGDDYE